jgi:hypothetical protein
MVENLKRQTLEARNPKVKKLYETLLTVKQHTDDMRSASKTLRALEFLTGHTEYLLNGEANPDFALTGIAAIVLTPYILTKYNAVLVAIATSDVASVLGWGAFTGVKLPIVSKSEGLIKDWVYDWTRYKKESEIDGKDVSHILTNLPKTTIKSPEEIFIWLTEDNNSKKKKEPYAIAAETIHGLIRNENHYRKLNKKRREKREIKDTVELMLIGQTEMYREMGTDEYIAKEAVRKIANVVAGGIFGLTLSSLINHFFGAQFGGAAGALDDTLIFGIIYFYNPLKDATKQAIGKMKSIHLRLKPHDGLRKMEEKQQKIKPLPPESE